MLLSFYNNLINQDILCESLYSISVSLRWLSHSTPYPLTPGMLWPNESLWSVRRSMRCLSSSVRWLGSCQSRLCHRNEVLYHLELGIRYSSRSLSSWLVPTKLHPTLRIFLLIFRQKNIWPAGRNIYIRQLLYNQREWSVSSVGECRVSLCICDGLGWQ